MISLRDLGINLLGARNRALAELVTEMPPSLVADALGFSYQVAYQYAEEAASLGLATPATAKQTAKAVALSRLSRSRAHAWT